MSVPPAAAMPPRPLSMLLSGCTATITGDAGTTITGVAYDSRLVQAGNLFVALRGGYADGHRFIAQAAARGAVAVLVEEPPDVAPTGIRSVTIVPDTRATLAHVAANWYEHPADNLCIIGVTGTNGKTTTATMIAAVLDAGGFSTAMLGTVEIKLGATRHANPNHQTTPESLAVQQFLREAVTAGCTHAILEATSHGLATHRLDALPFDIAVFTNISHEHLEFHKTFAQYLAAKQSLFARLAAFPERTRPRYAVVNADDPHAAAFLSVSGGARQVTYALDQTATITASNITERIGATDFMLRTSRTDTSVYIETMGVYNVYNALAAVAVGYVLDVSLPMITAGLAAFHDVPGHLERIEMGQPFAVIVDFAHTPAAFAALLGLLHRTTAGKLIVVFGSAGERDVAKRAMQGAIAAQFADYAVFTNEDPRFEDADAILREIAAGATPHGWHDGQDYWCIADRATAITHAFRVAASGDTVALIGKGHENSIIIGGDAVPWDEASAARAALRHLGYADAV